MPTAVVIGSGGREHALVEALLASPSQPQVVAIPGNPGMPEEVSRLPVALTDWGGIEAACIHADLVVVGPEAPLVAGLADRLRGRGCAVLGPSAAAARLEGSKSFAKRLMDSVGVPTARWARFSEPAEAKAFANSLGGPAVVKVDGLAGGKGVVVAEDEAAADRAIDAGLAGPGDPSERSIVVEERLVGEELSVLALSDGYRLAVFPAAQDHKRLGEGDTGPNTGGMGAYTPLPRATSAVVEDIRKRCMQPVVDALAADGTPLVGVLYAGIMMTSAGPQVLEYNVRLGDPEAQVVLPQVAEDLYSAFRTAALGQLEARTLAVRPGSAMAVVLASAGYPAASRCGDVIEGLEDAAELHRLRVYHAATARDADGRWVTAGGRVLALTGLGNDLKTAAQIAYEGVARVRFSGVQYRRDIGHHVLGETVFG